MLLLAITGALTSKAYGQRMSSKFGWEIAMQGRVSLPFELAGVEPHIVSNETLTATWNPLVSQSFGVRINNRLKKSWTFGTGIMWIRRNYSVEFNYDNALINTSDTIHLLRAMSYRIPLIAETRVNLGKGYFITAAGGVGVEFSPSDSVVNDFDDGDEEDPTNPQRDYEAYLGRLNWAAFPFMAEVGIEKQPVSDIPGFYLGVFWSKTISEDYWTESVWDSSQQGILGEKIRGSFASTLAGIELRILLK